MDKLYDVIIAGAGPVGLFLACELGMKNISVLVLEREPEPDSPWKIRPLGMRGLNTASVEAFNRRGLLDKVADSMKRSDGPQQKAPPFAGHFAGILLNANKFDVTRFKYRLQGPPLVLDTVALSELEAVLAVRAANLGVTILRGKSVTEVSQVDDIVTVGAGDQEFRAKWLVGCDGGRSVVRKAAGFEFVGTEPKFTGYMVKADLDHIEKLKIGFHVVEGGMYVLMRAGNFSLLDFDGGRFDRTRTPTVEHVQDVLTRVTGTDVKITKLHLVSTFTDRCKQATTYRKGRILLAGDAAHIHSPLGGQGLNLGLGDAINLGWKLAATVQASKPSTGPLDLTLLDTYEQERHPVAAGVLEWSRAQVSALSPDPHAVALRKLVAELIDTVDGTSLIIDRVWGLSLRYNLGDEHPLVGCSAPDFELNDGSKLGSKLEGGQGVLVSFHDDEALKELAKKYGRIINYVGVGAKDQLGLDALLIRPDGIVAWVAEKNLDTERLKVVLGRWFESAAVN